MEDGGRCMCCSWGWWGDWGNREAFRRGPALQWVCAGSPLLGTVAWCSRMHGRCVCRESGGHALPHGAGAACPGGPTEGGSHSSHTPAWSCTSPWHRRPGPPYLCPAMRHRLISPGARSRCADALVPAPDSQPPALAAAFLEQLREGRSSQDCLMRRVNVTLPQALLPTGSWQWVHCHRVNSRPKIQPWGRDASGATLAPGHRAG